MTRSIALVGDFDERVLAHQAIPVAIRLASAAVGVEVNGEWVGTGTIDPHHPALGPFHGIWCVPASPYDSMAGALAAIRMAREGDIPFLGTCGGFQHAVMEVAASLWGLEGAGHSEVDPSADHPVIAPLSCSLVEKEGTVRLQSGSRLARAYGGATANEGYHCSYGFNPAYAEYLEKGPLRATAWDLEGDVRGVELDSHPFFVATLFQPERAGLRGEVSPVVASFLEAVVA